MLKELCNAGGVSGNEKEIRDIIINAIKPYCDSIKIDKLGNIIALKKGNKKSGTIMIAAHMDEVGFMIKSIEESGSLKFAPAGGIDPRVMIGKRLLVGKDKIPGILAYKPIHVQRDDYKNIPKVSDLNIDIGAKDKKDAEKYASAGDYAIFDTEFEKTGNLLKGKAFDDRFGCYALIELLKKKHDSSIYAVFTVQEEVGLRGASAAAYGIMPDYALIFEGTSAAEFPEKKDLADFPKMGEGVVITISDRSMFSDRWLLESAQNVAKKNKVKFQFKQPMIGGTDAGVIHTTGKGCRSLVFAVPCRYIHSPVGYADMRDLKSMIKLGELMIKEINKGAHK